MINQILETSAVIKNNRSLLNIWLKLNEEVGELAQEINILDGYVKPSKGGVDGIKGEAIDVIINVIDLLYKLDDSITEEELLLILQNKLDKWKHHAPTANRVSLLNH
jgi:NTP pyrophosphatase (non-canonical NTP hydrolase)